MINEILLEQDDFTTNMQGFRCRQRCWNAPHLAYVDRDVLSGHPISASESLYEGPFLVFKGNGQTVDLVCEAKQLLSTTTDLVRPLQKLFWCLGLVQRSH